LHHLPARTCWAVRVTQATSAQIHRLHAWRDISRMRGGGTPLHGVRGNV